MTNEELRAIRSRHESGIGQRPLATTILSSRPIRAPIRDAWTVVEEDRAALLAEVERLGSLLDVPYRPGLPPEHLRRSVPLWQARLRTGSRPFMLSFSDDERQCLPHAAKTDPDWDRLECRPCDANGTPCPWID